MIYCKLKVSLSVLFWTVKIQEW